MALAQALQQKKFPAFVINCRDLEHDGAVCDYDLSPKFGLAKHDSHFRGSPVFHLLFDVAAEQIAEKVNSRRFLVAQAVLPAGFGALIIDAQPRVAALLDFFRKL